MTLYEIAEDFIQITALLDGAVDEAGNARDLSESEIETINEWFKENAADLENKADNYGKFITNLKMQAEEAEATRKMYKEELDRLSTRAKVFENRRKSILSGLQYAMTLMGKEKIKTSLFSFGIQNSQMSINTDAADVKSIPEAYLERTVTVSKSAIKDGIKKGMLIVTESGTILKSDGEILEGVRAEKNKILVMR